MKLFKVCWFWLLRSNLTRVGTNTAENISWIYQPQLHACLRFLCVCLGRERPSRYLSIKLPCGGLGGPIQTHRGREKGRRKERKKREGKGRARGALTCLTAPSLTSQRRPSSSAPIPHPSPLPPLTLCVPLPPLLTHPSPLALCRFTGLQLPARLSVWGPRVQGSMSVCVGVEMGDLVACLSVLQCFLTFFSFSHTALNNQVLPEVCT